MSWGSSELEEVEEALGARQGFQAQSRRQVTMEAFEKFQKPMGRQEGPQVLYQLWICIYRGLQKISELRTFM